MRAYCINDHSGDNKKIYHECRFFTSGKAGFPHALVVWAFECIPNLSGSLMFCCQNISSRMSKMNNWLIDVHPDWNELARKIFDKDDVIDLLLLVIYMHVYIITTTVYV